ncbi:MAG: hypothetical protein ACE5GB_15535, partial [Acidimicrobiales bacterium]
GRLADEADRLASRIRLVVVGGADMSAGLWALDRVASSFDRIENRGADHGSDGRISRSDLEWAASELDSDTATAARWLLDHDDFWTSVETARANDAWLDDPYSDHFPPGAGADGLLSRDDIDAFHTKAADWATLRPHLVTIDTAAAGGDADGVLSRADFEAFLADYDLPPDVAGSVRAVLDEGVYHHDGGPGFGTMLDALSFVPVVGDVIDGARALYYALEGDYATAALYGLGLVPIPGLSGTGLRAAREVTERVATTAARRGGRDAVEEAAGLIVRGTVQNMAADRATRETFEAAGDDDGLLADIDRVLGRRMGYEQLDTVAGRLARRRI